MCLCGAKVTQMKLYFGQTEQCLIVSSIVFETFLILLEGILIVFLCVVDFAQDEVEG